MFHLFYVLVHHNNHTNHSQKNRSKALANLRLKKEFTPKAYQMQQNTELRLPKRESV